VVHSQSLVDAITAQLIAKLDQQGACNITTEPAESGMVKISGTRPCKPVVYCATIDSVTAQVLRNVPEKTIEWEETTTANSDSYCMFPGCDLYSRPLVADTIDDLKAECLRVHAGGFYILHDETHSANGLAVTAV
jgi:hypothetical protein